MKNRGEITVFKKSYLSHVLSVIVAGGYIALPANAQTTTDTANEPVEETIVIGTRVAGRTAIQSSVPIDVINSEDIAKGGSTQTVEMIQTLVPSFNSFKNSITDATDYVRPAQLRGLGPEHTLVLVNGKRRHTSAVVHDNEQARGSVSVDLNSIPPGAIGKIEVLRDGAAAQYGSDAVAGVINISLKRSTDFEANVTYGQYYSDEDRGYEKGEALNGTNTDVNVRGANSLIDWTNQTSTKHHSDGQSKTFNISKGFDLGDKGYIGGSLQYWKQAKADRAGIDPTYQYFGTLPNGTLVVPTTTNTNPLLTAPAALVTPDPKEQTIDREMWWFGRSEMENIGAMLNADYDLSDAATLYSFANYSFRDGRGPCFWREPRSINNVRSIHPDGYLPNVTPENTDISFSLGVKGKISEFNYDFSSTYGSNNFHFFGDTLNVSLGNASPTSFDGGGSKFQQATYNADFSQGIEVGFATALNIAFGAEFRQENYEIYLGQPESYTNGGVKVLDGPDIGKTPVVGTQCVQCFFPVDATDQSRSNYAAYVDLETDVVTGLTLGTAARYEDYSDFGDTFNGKLSGRYAFNDAWAIRSSVSTGFRAPALQQQYYSNRSLQSNPDGSLKQTGTYTVESDTAKGLGAIPLKAEESKSISLGTTLELGDFTLSVDAYQVEVDDRVLLSELFAPKAGSEAAFYSYLDTLAGSDSNLKGVQQANFFINGLDTKTKGVDIVANYKPSFDMPGELSLTVSANFNKTEALRLAATPSQLTVYTNQTLLTADKVNNIEQATPSKVFNYIIDYNINQFSLRWKTVYYGGITVAERFWKTDADFQRYSGTAIHDLELRYAFNDEAQTLSFGANNILDTYPDKRYKSQSKLGELPYSGYQPFGFMGRYIYTRLDVKF
jgi:iron complex outermembrane recepter protein